MECKCTHENPNGRIKANDENSCFLYLKYADVHVLTRKLLFACGFQNWCMLKRKSRNEKKIMKLK